MALKGVSFTVHEGEIFGIAGVSGNGQHELAEVLAGLRKAEGGKVMLDGKDITQCLQPGAMADWAWATSPPNAYDVGSIGDFSLVENVAMNYYFDDKLSPSGGSWITGSMRKLTEELIAEYDVATPSADTKAKNLSGGNLQKLILARVLSRKPAAGDRQSAHPGAGCGRDRVRAEQAHGGQEGESRQSCSSPRTWTRSCR